MKPINQNFTGFFKKKSADAEVSEERPNEIADAHDADIFGAHKKAGERKTGGGAFDPYAGLPESFTKGNECELSEHLRELNEHILLPKSEKKALLSDFGRAMEYYAESGVRAAEALERLDVKNLGGFYSRPAELYYPLDDAAKIYPLSMKRGKMAVFRLSVYLKEAIVPELLQMALTFTIKRFPSFATTVKRGFFWHYLDSSKKRYVIAEESAMPCRPLPIEKSGSASFRVLYWKNRISCEYFHVLTDGTGGMVFLKTLTAEYLRLSGIKCDLSELPDINGTPTAGEVENAFEREGQCAEGKGAGFVDRPAVQLGGRLSRERPCRVLNIRMNAPMLKAAATGMGATVTSYMLAVMFVAGRASTDRQDGEMSIQMPVNMRKFFPSDTLRNFALFCGIRLPMTDITDVKSVVPLVAKRVSELASKESLSVMMGDTVRLVNGLRFVPLRIKASAARLVYGFLGGGIFTNTLSNLGVQTMPEGLRQYVVGMDFVLGTTQDNGAGCSLVTYGDTATLSIVKNTEDPTFEEKLVSLLTKDGIYVEVDGSKMS